MIFDASLLRGALVLVYAECEGNKDALNSGYANCETLSVVWLVLGLGIELRNGPL